MSIPLLAARAALASILVLLVAAPAFAGLLTPNSTADSVTWDQMRMILSTADPKCNFKDTSSLGTNGCFDVDKQVRALATREGAALPYTGRLCVSVFLKWADSFEQKWDESRQVFTKERSKVVMEYMAQDCVTYTAQ